VSGRRTVAGRERNNHRDAENTEEGRVETRSTRRSRSKDREIEAEKRREGGLHPA
jgi:hypothetical protein